MIQGAEAAGFSRDKVTKLQSAYAGLLITAAAKAWIKEMATPRILVQEMSRPDGNVWKYIRNHIDDVPLRVAQQWGLDQAELKAHLRELAKTTLKKTFCNMIQNCREPWRIMYDR